MSSYNDDHFISFYSNHFLGTKEGSSILDKLFKDSNPELHQKITQQVDYHNQVLKHLGLDDREGNSLLPKKGPKVVTPDDSKNA